MAMATATFSYILHLLLLLPFPMTCVAAPAPEPLGFSAILVRGDSPASPLYDPSSSPAQRAPQVRSGRRSRRPASDFNDSKIVGRVVSSDDMYLMRLMIGTPPRPYWLSIDTGSDIVWVACNPCEPCFADRALIFDPSRSSSYDRQSCTTPQCAWVRGECDDRDLCRFSSSYDDGSTIEGMLSSDTIVFDNSGGRRASFSNIVFGCVHREITNFPRLLEQVGLIGLGPRGNSLVNQIGSAIDYKFAHCLPPVNGETDGWIKFGRDADGFSGESGVQVIPMGYGRANHYTLILQDISVDGDRVHIQWRPPRVPSRDDRSFIVDSGSEWIYLARYAYDQVLDDVRAAVEAEGFISGDGLLCYHVDAEDPYDGFPDMTLHFIAADWQLSPSHLFQIPREGIACLAVQPEEEEGQGGVIGGLAQQNMYIKFDNRWGLLSIAPADCEVV